MRNAERAKIMPRRIREGQLCLRGVCELPAKCRGYCLNHYELERRAGRVEKLPRVSGDCKYEDCDNAANGLDQMCSKHRERERKGIYSNDQLTKRPARTALERDEFGRKQCIFCLNWLPEEMYYVHSHASDGLRHNCKDCHGQKCREDPDKERLRIYGLSPDDVARILAELNGQCPICSIEISDSFVVDHDHACCPRRAGPGGKTTCGKCVRGLICGRCNTGLGMFLDNPVAIRNAALYLESSVIQKPEGECK